MTPRPTSRPRGRGCSQYVAILLTDIGFNTLPFHPDVWLHGNTFPNRLNLIREHTGQGGGLMMAGGCFSFQGIDGKARWHGTPVEAALPVTCLPHDDRYEAPEGIEAEILQPAHPIVAGPDETWPALVAFEIRGLARLSQALAASLHLAYRQRPLTGIAHFGRRATRTKDGSSSSVPGHSVFPDLPSRPGAIGTRPPVWAIDRSKIRLSMNRRRLASIPAVQTVNEAPVLIGRLTIKNEIIGHLLRCSKQMRLLIDETEEHRQRPSRRRALLLA